MYLLHSITPMNSILIALASIIITVLWLKTKKSNKSLPPGPWGLPIIGYLPWLTDAPRLDFNNLSKKYGNVFRIHIMRRDFYIFNNYNVIKEAFVNQKNNFIRRPTEFAFLFWALGYNAIGSTNDNNWKMHRKFALKSFTTLGLGKVELELRMHRVINTLLTYMEKVNGQPHDYTDIVTNCSYNILGLLIINRTFDMNNADYIEVKNSATNTFLPIQGYDNILYGPWFRLFKGHKLRASYRKVLSAKTKIATRKIVGEYLENPNANGEITSYMDAFYQQMMKDNANNNRNSTFDVETMVANVFALLQPGSDDLFNIKHCGLCLMTIYPEIQANVRKELDEVVGRKRFPSVQDKPLLPYTEAVLNEILRYACIFPTSAIHMTEVETTIGGYRIPKDAACISNLFNATRDKRFFENPDKFDPNHFLDEEGKFVRQEANIPFSIGSRNCLGEPLVRMAFFLFMTTILQNYNLSEPPNTKLKCEIIESVERMLLPYEICATKRT